MVGDFKKAHTTVCGVSVDSVYSHANWGSSIGGVSFPLLADFHPKGAVAKSLGIYLEDKGITDRATIIIDADGVVQYANSAGPGGQRDISELLKKAQEIDSKYGKDLPDLPSGEGLSGNMTLYVKNSCGASTAAKLAVDNLHCQSEVKVVNVSEDKGAMDELKAKTQKTQAPCLVENDKPLFESADIIAKFAGCKAPL